MATYQRADTIRRTLECLEQQDLDHELYELIVVDEPMVGLDPRSAKLLKDLFRTFVGHGGTVFLSTHTLELTASNQQFTQLDPTLIKDSSGDQPRGMAQVAEWTRAGTTIWGIAGWTSYRQDEEVPYAITT